MRAKFNYHIRVFFHQALYYFQIGFCFGFDISFIKVVENVLQRNCLLDSDGIVELRRWRWHGNLPQEEHMLNLLTLLQAKGIDLNGIGEVTGGRCDDAVRSFQLEAEVVAVTIVTAFLVAGAFGEVVQQRLQHNGAGRQWLLCFVEDAYYKVGVEAGDLEAVDVVATSLTLYRAASFTVTSDEANKAITEYAQALVINRTVEAGPHIFSGAPFATVPCGVEDVKTAHCWPTVGTEVQGTIEVERGIIITNGVDRFTQVYRFAVTAVALIRGVVNVTATVASVHVGNKEEYFTTEKFAGGRLQHQMIVRVNSGNGVTAFPTVVVCIRDVDFSRSNAVAFHLDTVVIEPAAIGAQRRIGGVHTGAVYFFTEYRCFAPPFVSACRHQNTAEAFFIVGVRLRNGGRRLPGREVERRLVCRQDW